ncbi:ABC transporter substrate-binding protein [Roseomonas sp. BN140053]|uniref:ABC transporter substrate-binding protein n=1 Tax=Roseomonas sp. BN140053 TaxID=3391898 RepID=UPI0039E7CB46
MPVASTSQPRVSPAPPYSRPPRPSSIRSDLAQTGSERSLCRQAGPMRHCPYDPAGARRLLAEAGFPNGFRMTLHTSNDRHLNDARTAQTMAQMWSRVGVQTAVEALPWSSSSVRVTKQEFGMSLLG